MSTRLYSSAQVRELDRRAIEDFAISGLTLMRRAADACVTEILARYPHTQLAHVYCGSGNNAGDGFIIAGMLAEARRQVIVIVVGDTRKLGADASAALEYCQQSGVRFVDGVAAAGGEPDLVVDALLGTGIRGSLRSGYAEAISAINASDCPVLAVDVPSGLDADSGTVHTEAVIADVTVTFIGDKRGLHTADGPDHCGTLVVADLAVPDTVFDAPLNGDVVGVAVPQWPARRPRNSHKNTFGHVLVVGGDHGMGGAVLMAAEAALRTGAGMVSVASRPEHMTAMLSRCPEVMFRGVDAADETLDALLKRATVCVVGPGLGTGDWGRSLLEKVLATTLPLIVDADALNLMAALSCRRDNWILTPHPGEARRLANPGDQDRFAQVMALQQRYGGVVILKGVGSLITDGETIRLCQAGNPGMAAAGMGDVLSGILGALVGQGSDLFAAATHGVWLHANAGDLAAQQGMRGLLATDLLARVRELMA